MALGKDHIIKLTLALYQVTKEFPKDEPLKTRIRDVADDFLVQAICNNPRLDSQGKRTIINDIKSLKAYFRIAKAQNWVNPKNFDILEGKYMEIYEDIRYSQPVRNEIIQERIARKDQSARLLKKDEEKQRPGLRREKILEFLKKNKTVSLEELKSLLPSVSQRTLRRDVEYLLKKRAINRKRLNKRDVFYEVRDI